MAWSEAQMEAIMSYDKNLLVAAAAGSGKTSVLVERIIRRLLDEAQDFNIDEVLVVTFTNAAAAEMRQRIFAAIDQALKDRPQSRRLERQLVLLNAASISTLHAFCQNVIRQNFHRIDLDPKFRLANEQETELLKRDVIEALFEMRYAEGDAEFLRFAEHYGDARGDEALYEIVLKLYAFSRSQPNPTAWLECLPIKFERAEEQTMEETEWPSLIKKQLRLEFAACIGQTESMIWTAEQVGFTFYLPVLQSDLELLQSLDRLLEENWDAIGRGVRAVKFATLRAPKDTDEAQKEYFMKKRGRVKDKLKALKESYFAVEGGVLLEDLRTVGPVARAVCKLTIDFTEAFSRGKRAKTIVDFSDLEHLCLDILRDASSTPERARPSSVAVALQKKYKEVMVDEYQDINGVQEAILLLIKKTETPNLFLVGDVKQSVYRFRLAEPELFLQKYHAYPMRGASYRRIDLAQNFRSRSGVLHAINFIFAQVMSPQVTELSYGEAEHLNRGTEYPELPQCQRGVAGPVEVYLIDRDGQSVSDAEPAGAEEDAEEVKGFALESRFIAERVKELMAQGSVVFDKEKKSYRPLEWCDVVVLLRSVKNKAGFLLEAFHNNDVPAYADADAGYFQEIEVQIMLSLLSVIDNPEQDIPLASVLHSPIGNFDAEELARIHLLMPEGSLFTALLKAVDAAADLPESVKIRAVQIVGRLSAWRTLARLRSVPELIWQLFRDTGYYDYVGGMPGGLLRQANLRMLYDRARQYETTNFRGLFRFLRFIHKMRETGTDLAVARTLGESENVVRIMSIHKSKGLEFPVVIVADLGKKFNLQDSAATLLIHKKFGLGPYVTSAEPNLRYPTVARQAIAWQMNRENRAEELRVLYVALTRARERLILVGSAGNLNAKAEEWCQYTDRPQTLLPDHAIAAGGSYLDWICPALARHADGALLRDYGASMRPWLHENRSDPSCWKITILAANEIAPQGNCGMEDDGLLEQIRQRQPLPETGEQKWVRQRLEWEYPDSGVADVPAKLSVSEMKRRFDLSGERNASLFQAPPIVRRPRFLQQKTALSGEEYGTILHSVMQHIDFQGSLTLTGLQEQLDWMIRRELLLPEYREFIDLRGIHEFCDSEIGKRMRASAKVRREMPFSVMLEAKRFYPAVRDTAERIFVQGIVDVLFDEPDGMVLVDYKTDQGATDEIAEKYKMQLNLYAEAIEKILSKPVKERYLYLLAAGKFVSVTP